MKRDEGQEYYLASDTEGENGGRGMAKNMHPSGKKSGGPEQEHGQWNR